MTRKTLPFLLAVVTVLAVFAVPASARIPSDQRIDARSDVAPVGLECAPRVTDAAAAVHCEWRVGDDVDVRAWQLWNIQLRPERGGRNLVAKLGADVTSYTDTEVAAPARYLYAVLGLDHNGRVVARSRVESVNLVRPDVDVEAMRMDCAAHRIDAEPGVAVGCHWREVHNDAAVGYVVWKQVDGGTRSVLARVGLDVTEVRDNEVRPGHRFTYVVTAVDGAGHVVGRSRAQHVGIPALDRPDVRPDDRPVDRPSVRPVEVDVAPTVDTAPEVEAAAVADHVRDVPTDRVRVRDAVRGERD